MQYIIEREKTIEEVELMSPLIWAYIGDCVYELYIRAHLINTTKLKPHMLHINTIKFVKAEAQARTLKNLFPLYHNHRKPHILSV